MVLTLIMFFRNKRLYGDWVIRGLLYMIENDRSYIALVNEKSPQIDVNSDEYIAGRYLFRAFGTIFAEVGSAFKKLKKSYSDELHLDLSIAIFSGSDHLKDKFPREVSRMKDSGFFLEPLPTAKLLTGESVYKGNLDLGSFIGTGCSAFSRYCLVNEKIPDELNKLVESRLIDLYSEAIAYPLKLEDDQISFYAIHMFSAARKSIFED